MKTIRLRRRLLVPLALVLLLLLPVLASAHVQEARPQMQRAQRERLVDVALASPALGIELHNSAEPLRHYVRHDINPAGAEFRVEYRRDASDADAAFHTTWRLDRLLEYTDLNQDGLYQPGVDTPVKAWRLQYYRWKTHDVQNVQVGGVAAKSVLWEGNLSGGPDLRLQMAVAGKDFADEGAFVRPQDVILYLDVVNLPRRGLGSLYVIEGSLTSPRDAKATLYETQNLTTSLLVDQPHQRGVLVWGGEAVLDGREQVVNATLGEPDAKQAEADPANTRRPFFLHIPRAEESMRFVMVSGIEYTTPAQRGAPAPAAAGLLAALAAAALVFRRR